MNIQEYRDKVSWYFREEYSELPETADFPEGFRIVDEVAKGSDELSDDIDNLIESAYKKKIHFPVASRKLRDILKRYCNDIGEGT